MTRTRLISSLVAIALGVAALVSATPAQAQPTLNDEEKRLLTTLLAGTTASTSIYILQRLTDHALDRMLSDAERYMRENSVALRHDVTLGGGESLLDLATLFGVSAPEQRDLFLRARAQRAALLPLLRGEHTTREDALRFARIVLTSEQYTRIEGAP